MKNRCKNAVFFLILLVGITACGDDDDDGFQAVPIRDRAEVEIEDRDSLEKFLKTHYYKLVENDFLPTQSIRFDRIDNAIESENSLYSLLGENPNDGPALIEKFITIEDVEHKYYILSLRQGAENIIGKPTIADSVLVTFRGLLTREVFDTDDLDRDGIPNNADVDYDGNDDGIPDNSEDKDNDGINDAGDSDDDGSPGVDLGKSDADLDGVIDELDNSFYDSEKLFDNSATPIWFNNIGIVTGFRQGLLEFSGVSSYTLSQDGNYSFADDYGNGAVFFPSGLGYFASPPPGSGIPVYSPLIFSFQTFVVQEADHDNDGIPTYLENFDNDNFIFNDDYDEDGLSNFEDIDDDNDGILTRNEIRLVEGAMDDGRVTPSEIIYFTEDANNNGIPAYLDPEETIDRSLEDND